MLKILNYKFHKLSNFSTSSIKLLNIIPFTKKSSFLILLKLGVQSHIIVCDLKELALDLAVDQMQTVGLGLKEHFGTLKLHIG